MKRNKPLRRKTPLRANPETTRLWKERSLRNLPKFSVRRRREQTAYSKRIEAFLAAHPTCPVSREPTSQIHHSSKRYGKWLLLERYWIAVSMEGHMWIEENKREAEELRLMVRINETYDTHVAKLIEAGVDLTAPVYYLVNEN